MVEVSSSLNNCLKAGGYYDTTFPNTVARMMGANNGNGAMEEAIAAGMSAGENASEAVINEVFERFCVGK